jgi:hypothetical protein
VGKGWIRVREGGGWVGKGCLKVCEGMCVWVGKGCTELGVRGVWVACGFVVVCGVRGAKGV